MTYAATKYEVAMSKRLRRSIYTKMHYLTIDIKVTGNVAQHPLHHVTYASQFKVARSKGLGGDAITRKYIV